MTDGNRIAEYNAALQELLLTVDEEWEPARDHVSSVLARDGFKTGGESSGAQNHVLTVAPCPILVVLQCPTLVSPFSQAPSQRI